MTDAPVHLHLNLLAPANPSVDILALHDGERVQQQVPQAVVVDQAGKGCYHHLNARGRQATGRRV